jgi:hypothetical protein
MQSDFEHVPLDALWRYAINKNPLTSEQFVHAINCKQCVYVLSVCMYCPSFEDLKAIAAKTLHGSRKLTHY